MKGETGVGWKTFQNNKKEEKVVGGMPFCLVYFFTVPENPCPTSSLPFFLSAFSFSSKRSNAATMMKEGGPFFFLFLTFLFKIDSLLVLNESTLPIPPCMFSVRLFAVCV